MKEGYRESFTGKSRLYAFPMKPDLPTAKEFIIIDSGAYGLSQQGKEIDAEHMFKLSNFYKKYGASNKFPALAIAPDKFLDPHTTMNNYKFWMKYINHPVVPVIQFPVFKKIDLLSALKQVDFYIENRNIIMAISNPGLNGKQGKSIAYLIEYMRKNGVEWIHNLGAGWNANDCKDWFDLGFNSIDSISYYTDADRGIEWKPFSYSTGKTNKTVKQIILNNYNLANYAAGK